MNDRPILPRICGAKIWDCGTRKWVGGFSFLGETVDETGYLLEVVDLRECRTLLQGEPEYVVLQKGGISFMENPRPMSDVISSQGFSIRHLDPDESLPEVKPIPEETPNAIIWGEAPGPKVSKKVEPNLERLESRLNKKIEELAASVLRLQSNGIRFEHLDSRLRSLAQNLVEFKDQIKLEVRALEKDNVVRIDSAVDRLSRRMTLIHGEMKMLLRRHLSDGHGLNPMGEILSPPAPPSMVVDEVACSLHMNWQASMRELLRHSQLTENGGYVIPSDVADTIRTLIDTPYLLLEDPENDKNKARVLLQKLTKMGYPIPIDEEEAKS